MLLLMWNLKKRYKWTYLQNRNRHTDIENKLMVTSGRSACMLSHALFATQWTVAHQIPLPKGFSRQEYWSALPFPPPGDLPHPGIEPWSPALQADSLWLSHQGKIMSCKFPLASVFQPVTMFNIHFVKLFTLFLHVVCFLEDWDFQKTKQNNPLPLVTIS